MNIRFQHLIDVFKISFQNKIAMSRSSFVNISERHGVYVIRKPSAYLHDIWNCNSVRTFGYQDRITIMGSCPKVVLKSWDECSFQARTAAVTKGTDYCFPKEQKNHLNSWIWLSRVLNSWNRLCITFNVFMNWASLDCLCFIWWICFEKSYKVVAKEHWFVSISFCPYDTEFITFFRIQQSWA